MIRADAIEVGDRIGGLIQSIPKTQTGHYDIATLGTLARVIKEKFPDKTDATFSLSRTSRTTCWCR